MYIKLIVFNIFLTISIPLISQFQLNGSASIINCKCYQLNPDINSAVGSVWNIYKIDLNQPFDYEFEVNVGCNSSPSSGADGMVFAIQPLSTSIGVSGGEMGLGGVTPSLGVFIDTWQNNIHNDPYNDHISINLNGDVNHSSSNNVAGPYDLGEIENCFYEPLRVTWDPLTTIINVYYNNLLVLTYNGDLINNVFNGDPMVYWGFTASTGGASNFHRFCIDVPDLTIDTSNLVMESEKCDQENGSINGLNIINGISPYDWTWNGNISTNLDTFNLNSGSYTLSVTDGLGCVTSQVFIIEDFGPPIIDTSNMILKNEDCDQQNGFIEDLNIISSADSIQYYWNGNLSDSLNIYNLSQGDFEIITLDNHNCSDTLTLNIMNTNFHDFSIGYNSLIMEAGQPIDFYEISSDSTISWLWTFGNDSSSTISNPSHTYTYYGNYNICLISTNEFNCYDTSCIEIELLPGEIIIPNIFTPNNDLINDEFIIKGINDKFKIQIFNRWGKLVFEEENYSNNWNGTQINGKKLNSGVYYFILKNIQDKIEKTGSFRLVNKL